MRLFAAIDIPDEIRNYLSRIQEQIGNDLANLNWVRKENIHITLKFLGEAREEDITKIKKILASIKFRHFSLVIDSIGLFPDESYIRVVWVGLNGLKGAEKLFELHKTVDMGLSRMFGMEKQFLGHITLARVKFVRDKKQFVDRLKSIRIEEKKFDVNSFKLYKSTLTTQGPVYEVIEEYNLII